MQYLACCDYFRTSLLFGVPDIYRFVGEITMFRAHENLVIYCRDKKYQYVADNRSDHNYIRIIIIDVKIWLK